MFKRFTQKNIENKGFTLVEALVAISILMIAIASPMTLSQKSLSTATLSKDQMIASFLAQDAIESVRSIRDQIAVSNFSGDWLDSTLLENCICDDNTRVCSFNATDPTYCSIDTTSSNWQDPPDIISQVSDPGPLKISYVTASLDFLKYDYSGTNCSDSNIATICNSKFNRKINIKKSDSNSQEAVVNVRVSWSSPQGLQLIEVSDFIYNYSENL